jgi:hypothetical protein
MAVLGQVATEAFPQLTISKSQTWVPPQDGTVCIHVVAAGGGGTGAATHRGGGAGAYAKVPSLAVTTSGSFTLVVGSGGAGTTNGGNATNGGSSTIAGTGLTGTKTCEGGYGATTTSSGSGGSVSGSGESWAGYSGGAGVTAGGAVGVFATGNNGSVMLTDATAGGLGMSGFGIICGGSMAPTTPDVYLHSGTITYTPYPTGDLCGGGAIQTSSQPYYYMFGGDGGIGGGGGGAKNAGGAGYTTGGRGGDGIILIQYLPW